MAILRIDGKRAILGVAWILGACQPSGEGLGDFTSAFPHATHVEQGMDCSDCHGGVEDSDEPGIPPAMLCNTCHEGLDEEKPAGKRVADLFTSGGLAPRHLAALPDETLFSHLAHVQAGVDCADCHGPVGESNQIPREVRVDMAECVDCHESRGLAADCATCHSEIRADRPPPSHQQMWLEVHGETALARTGGAMADCALCHEESSCSACHQNEMPRSHTQFWRRRGHGQIAAFDRQSCSTCHQSDSCNRCHSEARPATHTARWGGVRNDHCFSCHLPLRSEGCVTCHRNADVHFTAPPRPPTHFPGMDCRQCHGLTAPLPHADDGSDCTICHS